MKVYYNTKILTYRDGRKKYVYSSKPIFPDPQTENISSDVGKILENSAVKTEKIPRVRTRTDETEIQKDLARNLKRAKDSVFDIAYQNEFTYFYTVTFDQERYNSYQPKDIIYKVQTFLHHAVERKGLAYVLVAERHKKGGIHLHFLGNDVFTLVDSGTRLVYGYKKPIKLETIKKRKIPEDRIRKIVYNVTDWHFGFSTAIKLEGDPYAIASYITKYITKDMKKIFGKYFWSSKNLVRAPIVEVATTSFHDIVASIVDSNVGLQFKYKSEFTKLE